MRMPHQRAVICFAAVAVAFRQIPATSPRRLLASSQDDEAEAKAFQDAVRRATTAKSEEAELQRRAQREALRLARAR